MIRPILSLVHVTAGLAVLLAWLAGSSGRPAAADPARPGQGGHRHGPGTHHAHDHPPASPAYAETNAPDHIWTDPRTLARGKEIYLARCALCHGERGDGTGPGAAGLPLKPADLTDARMVAEMPGNVWFWRVSEGGLVEPFRSRGSAMPAWKDVLSVAERWAVIAYAHSLSGHRGAHVASEHPELAPAPRLVTGEGRVTAVAPRRQQVVLEHGKLEGFMDAMTMGYRVDPPALLGRVKPGDRVRFTIDTRARAITEMEPIPD